MDYNEVYWIYIVGALGYGNYKVKSILEQYQNAKDFYDKPNSLKYCSFLTPNNIESLKCRDLRKSYEIVKQCDKLGYEILTIENPQYPEKLKNISNPPAVLYLKGDLPDTNENLSISIVGTRSSTPYGEKVSFELGYKLARAGTVVVSGAALGIDSISQKGAMQAKGKTIAVLGCGLNVDYLIKNKELREEIANNGALVSEYPPGYRGASWTFPMRNRIISGLSDGTLVVEAGERSGSLITANLALEQNRDLFAVPGNINSSISYGTNKLIKICAKPVTCAEDILEEYYHLYPYLKKPFNEDLISGKIIEEENKEIPKLPENLSVRAKKTFKVLTDQPEYIDKISELTNMNISDVLQSITELELYELIKTHSGKRYSKP